jgi:DnaJ-class molecular chaperone
VAFDPYETLGVKRDATQDAIRAAYRKLAKKLHPDLNPGDKKAEDQFKSISAAYDLLSDPDKRARYDRGEIDEAGAERPQQRYYRDFQDADSGQTYGGTGAHADFGDIGDLFGDLFGRRGSGRADSFAMRGSDARYHLGVDFLDAVNGATKRITLPDGATLDVAIPPGTEDGQILRLRGKGGEGLGGGPAGDALITLEVRPHPFFTRNGSDIEVELPVTLAEAVLGGKLDVPTPAGPVRMSVPKGSNTGTRLRLKGKGVPMPGGGRGDEYVTLKVVLPEGRDEALEEFVRGWRGAQDQNPREHMER